MRMRSRFRLCGNDLDLETVIRTESVQSRRRGNECKCDFGRAAPLSAVKGRVYGIQWAGNQDAKLSSRGAWAAAWALSSSEVTSFQARRSFHRRETSE
jgi:hypothetical protein